MQKAAHQEGQSKMLKRAAHPNDDSPHMKTQVTCYHLGVGYMPVRPVQTPCSLYNQLHGGSASTTPHQRWQKQHLATQPMPPPYITAVSISASTQLPIHSCGSTSCITFQPFTPHHHVYCWAAQEATIRWCTALRAQQQPLHALLSSITQQLQQHMPHLAAGTTKPDMRVMPDAALHRAG